jgi:hypothetical protein
MLKKGQVSFFAIIGIFMVIITAGVLASTSRIDQDKIRTSMTEQAAVNEDRLLLEWYTDEVIRTSASGLGEKADATEIQNNITRIFDPAQFSRRGVEIIIGVPSVSLIANGQYLVIDTNLTVKLKRPWGSTRIESRSVKVQYNGTIEKL